jgi:hypothetical protein
MWFAWGKRKIFRKFWFGCPKIREHWDDLDVGGKMALS